MTKIISCNIHDHFEIACMHRSEISLVLHDGTTVKGQAVDLTTKNKNEFICLKTEGNQKERINLLEINTLQIGDSKELIHVS